MSIAILIDESVENEAVKYTFQTLLGDFLGLDFTFYTQKTFPSNEKALIIYYGPEKSLGQATPSLSIFASKFWSPDYYLKQTPSAEDLWRYNSADAHHLLNIINEKDLIVLFLGETLNEDKALKEPFIAKDDATIKTNIDIIAASFFLLSRYEEIVTRAKDLHGRFPVEASLAFQAGFLDRPLVNEYLELLWSWLSSLNPTLKRTKRNFQLFLTHDVDNIKLWTLKKRLRYTGRLLIKKKSIKDFLKYAGRTFLWFFLCRKNTFKFIIHLDQKYGFRSHFYFLLNGTSRYDNRFDPSSPKVQKLMQSLEEKGCEVGLHLSYSSFLDKKQLLKEKALLESIITNHSYGVRHHYLRFQVPESYHFLEVCGFRYDSTLAFAEKNGFRAGCCYPFHPYDFKNKRAFRILEYPLLSMDVSLTSKKYMSLSRKQRLVHLKNMVDKVAFFNGLFVFLVHNTSLEELEFRWRGIYRQILKYCKEKEELGKQRILLSS